MGIRAGKDKLGARTSKEKLGARIGKYKLGARVGKCKLGTRVGKYKLGARAGGQGQGRGSSKGIGAGKHKHPAVHQFIETAIFITTPMLKHIRGDTHMTSTLRGCAFHFVEIFCLVEITSLLHAIVMFEEKNY